jgi:two-component system, chemotaxis family, sensor kinase Cph1
MSEPIDLIACEREPISIPGSIQPHGLMLVLRGKDLLIVQASANSALFLNVGPDKLLGQPLAGWFDQKSMEALREVSQQENASTDNPLLLSGRVEEGARFDGILHRCGTDLVLELERLEPCPFLPSVRGALLRLQAASTEDEICRVAARETRRLTGFDRVMIYRFAADWSGEVVAEDRAVAMDCAAFRPSIFNTSGTWGWRQRLRSRW